MDSNSVNIKEWHHLYNYMHCCSLQLFGFNVHVNGLENLFLCLKFTINVFNTSNCLLLKQKKINTWAFYPKEWLLYLLFGNFRIYSYRNMILIIITTIKMVMLFFKISIFL